MLVCEDSGTLQSGSVAFSLYLRSLHPSSLLTTQTLPCHLHTQSHTTLPPEGLNKICHDKFSPPVEEIHFALVEMKSWLSIHSSLWWVTRLIRNPSHESSKFHLAEGLKLLFYITLEQLSTALSVLGNAGKVPLNQRGLTWCLHCADGVRGE